MMYIVKESKVAFIKQGDFEGEKLVIAEKIQRLRLQLLVHSRMYYELNINIISDLEFDKLGKQLIELQTKYFEVANKIVFAEAFKDWDGNTGAFLPLKDKWVIDKCNKLYGNVKSGGTKNGHEKIQQKAGDTSSKTVKGKGSTKFRCNSLF